MKDETQTEEDQDGEIRYFKSSSLAMFPDPSDELIGMWRDLFRQSRNWPDSETDPLSKSEWELYAMLTEKLKSHLSINFVEYNETTQEE